MPSKRSLNPIEQHELWLAYRRRSFYRGTKWAYNPSDNYIRWREWIKGWQVPTTTKLRDAPK